MKQLLAARLLSLAWAMLQLHSRAAYEVDISPLRGQPIGFLAASPRSAPANASFP